MCALFRRFLAAQRGSIAIIMALALLPILVLIGIAIDTGRTVSAKNGLADAVDAALLMLAREPQMSDEEARQFVEDRVNEMLVGVGTPIDFEIAGLRQTENGIDVDVEGSIGAAMMGIVGEHELDLGFNAAVVRESKKIEVALVLDNTGSMNSSGKIAALRQAATQLVEILTRPENAAEFVQISLVPFVTSVNIKAEDAFKMEWMDVAGTATYHGVNFDETDGPVNHFDLFDAMDVDWKGCVEARAEPYDVTDTPPSVVQIGEDVVADTLWVPYFWPDERDGNSNYSNSYMNDGVSSRDNEVRQRYTGKYGTQTASIDEIPNHTRGPNKSCARPIVPLTNDYEFVLDEIDEMTGWNGSGTNIALGLAWGWRVLSPGEPFTQGVSYDDDSTIKALVVLTDGENFVVNNGGSRNHNRSDYTGYGYLRVDGRAHRLGSTNRGRAAREVNDKVETLCEAIKDEGIRLYTITFRLNSNDLQNLFRACASEPAMYFNSPSNEQLQDAFEAIAYDLSNLRLSR